MAKYQAVRGTHDILPPGSELFQRLEANARHWFQRFGFQEIRTPTFESLDLFQRSLGSETDVVQKEMYAFEDRGGRKLALRPEGTAGVVRAFVEHHLSQTSPFCKLFYIGPMFRAERPQAGRYREFWQIGAEYFGNAAPAADAEVLLLVLTLFRGFDIAEFELKINSLGDSKCRPKYLEALLKYLESQKSDLCEDCQRRIKTNPLRALDCKTDAPRLASAPTIDAFWCDECRSHFQKVQDLLQQAGGTFVLAPRLVRGLDYYSRTVFELTSRALGAQDALAAGGRYDRLVKDIGGPDIPAIGFALGSERTIEAYKAGISLEKKNASGSIRVFVSALGEPAASEAFRILEDLRRSKELAERGVSVEGGFFEKKLSAQLTMADRLACTHCVILGEDEVRQSTVTLKSLKTGTQETLEKQRLISHLLSLDAKEPLD